MKKNLILFVHSVPRDALSSITEFNEKYHRNLEIAVLRDTRNRPLVEKKRRVVKYYLEADYSKPLQLCRVLQPLQQRLLAVTCRGESHLELFAKLIPEVPYLRTPTVQSLHWATNKIAMRQRLQAHNPKLSPRFVVVHDASLSSLEKIVKKVRFPLILKPAGLASSLLVSVCFHEEELENTLKKMLRKIHKLYKDHKREAAPQILAEQLMEGTMYSVDALVTSRGEVTFFPIVKVKTGREVGFDDFFGYLRMTPVDTLSKEKILAAQDVARQAVHALGLKSTSVHIELMRTESQWKIIELGARMGGFRHQIYQLSYGIDYALNDVLIRIPNRPLLKKRKKGYSVVMQIFAREEGTIKKLKGFKKVKQLESFVSLSQHLSEGGKCLFAKHGGKSVCDVTLFHKERSKLLADIRRIEQQLQITVRR